MEIYLLWSTEKKVGRSGLVLENLFNPQENHTRILVQGNIKTKYPYTGKCSCGAFVLISYWAVEQGDGSLEIYTSLLLWGGLPKRENLIIG